MNKLTKEQKNELDKVYRHFANNEKETKQGVYASIIKFDFKGLYIALDATARKINCENGSSYIIPMEDGNYFVQEFYNKYSTLDYYVDNKKARTIIDENASVKKEYEFLDFAKDLLSPTKLGIGQPVPDNFKTILKKLQKGDRFTINNFPYVCTSQYDSEAKFKPLATDNEIKKYRTFKDFQNVENTTMKYEYREEFQKAFNKLKAKSDFIEIKIIDKTHKNKENYISQAEKDLKNGESRTIQFGPEKFTIKRNAFTGKYKWYGQNGQSVDKNNIISYVTWLDTTPTYIEIKDNRQISDIQKEIDKEHTKEVINQNISKRDFTVLAAKIKEICNKNGKDFEVNFRAYDNMQATSFIFKKDKNKTKIFKAYYEENDLNNDVKDIHEIDIKEFEHFCQSRYDKFYENVYQENLTKCQERFMNSHLDIELKEV